jgi:hypothetical protein
MLLTLNSLLYADPAVHNALRTRIPIVVQAGHLLTDHADLLLELGGVFKKH